MLAWIRPILFSSSALEAIEEAEGFPRAAEPLEALQDNGLAADWFQTNTGMFRIFAHFSGQECCRRVNWPHPLLHRPPVPPGWRSPFCIFLLLKQECLPLPPLSQLNFPSTAAHFAQRHPAPLVPLSLFLFKSQGGRESEGEKTLQL